MAIDNYFNIFKNPKSHSKWDNHIEFASLSASASQRKVSEWVDALRTLQYDFGNDFLASTAKRENQFAELIKGKAPWQVSELIEIADVFRSLKKYDSNYSKLIGKLKGSKRDVAEGMYFLEASLMFLKSNFRIKFLDEIKTKATPDIELGSEHSNASIFVEISELNSSQSRDNLQDNYYALYNVWEAPDEWLPYSCSQMKFMSEQQLEHTISCIRKIRKEARANESLVNFESEHIRFSVAHISKYEELMALIDKKDYRKGLLGAPLDFDETERLCSNKLKQKAKQIPFGSAGIIFLSVNPLYFMFADVTKAIVRFIQKLEPLKNVFGVILFSNILNSDEEVLEETNKYIYRVRKVENSLSKYILFIKNHHCTITLEPEIQEKIYQSIKQ